MTAVGEPAPRRPRTRPTVIPIRPRPAEEPAAPAELAARVSRIAKGGARAAVLGVNDGLVTNICLILAVAGARASSASVRLAGFASLLAGSFSMAAGEWVSVRSQVELYSSAIADLRRLIADSPRSVLGELARRLEEAGFGRATAQLASTELPLDEPRFLQFLSSSLFGLDPEDLGSPMVAATSSFSLFAAGALVPLLPWFFTRGGLATILSIVLTAAASLVAGSYVARSCGRPVPAGAIRQLAIVVAASAVTFGLGKAFGAAVG